LIEQYGFLYANPALNLLQSAKQGKYCGIIYNVGLLEFFCIFGALKIYYIEIGEIGEIGKKDPTGQSMLRYHKNRNSIQIRVSFYINACL